MKSLAPRPVGWLTTLLGSMLIALGQSTNPPASASPAAFTSVPAAADPALGLSHVNYLDIPIIGGTGVFDGAAGKMG